MLDAEPPNQGGRRFCLGASQAAKEVERRSDRGRHQERGLILLVAMVSIAGLLTLTAVGMTRSLTERVAAKRSVAKQQAFYLAESGGWTPPSAN